MLKKDYLYYIPILKTIQSLLNNSNFLSKVLITFIVLYAENVCHVANAYVGGTGTQVIVRHHGGLL